MLRIGPAQQPRLLAIEANTLERLDEVRSMKWLGEVSALEESLRHIRKKREQMARTEPFRSLRPCTEDDLVGGTSRSRPRGWIEPFAVVEH